MKRRVRLHLEDLLRRLPALGMTRGSICTAYETLRESLRDGGTLFTCGNGGSAADAEHCVGELLKGFLLPRALSPDEVKKLRRIRPGHEGRFLASRLQGGLRAVSLTGHPSLTSAVANDIASELVFAQQLYVLGSAGDVLLAISTSGNARNVLMAAHVAQHRRMKVIGLTGSDGGRLRQMAEVSICVPVRETFLAQEYHVPVYHALCAMLEEEFFG